MTNRPALLAGAVQGRPAVRFDGAFQQLKLADFCASNNFTLLAVARTDDGQDIDPESNGIANDDGVVGQHYLFGGEDPLYPFSEVAVSLGTNGYSIYEGRRNQTGSSHLCPLSVWAGPVGTNFSLFGLIYSNHIPHQYFNGGFVHTGLVSPRPDSVFTRTIGWGGGPGGLGMAGELAELLVFDSQLSLAEVSVVNQYLNGTYVFAPPSTDPIQLAAVAMSSSQVALSWRQGGTNTFTSYLVLRRVGLSGPFTPIGQVGPDWRFIDAGVSPSTTYSYQIQSVFTTGTNAFSNVAVGQSLAVPTPFPSPACSCGCARRISRWRKETSSPCGPITGTPRKPPRKTARRTNRNGTALSSMAGPPRVLATAPS